MPAGFIPVQHLNHKIDKRSLIRAVGNLQSFVRLLDRYIVRTFLEAYLYCIAGFISIWLIFDVSDNISTFIDSPIWFRSYGSRIFISRNCHRCS